MPGERDGGYGPATGRFFRRAERELLPKLRESAAFLGISPPDDLTPDPKFCLELGMAIMLGKPIIILVARGRSLPRDSALFRVADEVVTNVDMDDAGADRVQDAVARVLAARGLL